MCATLYIVYSTLCSILTRHVICNQKTFSIIKSFIPPSFPLSSPFHPSALPLSSLPPPLSLSSPSVCMYVLEICLHLLTDFIETGARGGNGRGEGVCQNLEFEGCK